MGTVGREQALRKHDREHQPVIRAYTPADLEAIQALYVENFPGYTLRALLERLRTCRTWVYIQSHPIAPDSIIGYVITEGNYLSQICVHADHRGQGIGSELLRHAERVCKPHNSMWLQCLADNPAKALYERNGYTVTHIDPNMYGPGHPGVSMTKALSA
jgi:ribosomal protein S18 acetylase RimI-like enzyme